MLLEKGMSALRLEMTDRVYRTEYSVFGHDKLISRVVGEDYLSANAERRVELQRKFAREWDYCLTWNTLIASSFMGDYVSRMGHAKYAADGSDLSYNVSELFSDEEEVFAFDPSEKLPRYEQDELIRHFEKNYRGMCEWLPDAVNMTGIYVTCMSGLIDMLGWNMLLTCAGVDSKRFGDFTRRYCKWVEQFFDAMAASNVPVIMVHDDIVWTEGAFISPEWYREYIFPHYRKCFAKLHEAGKIILYTSDGNYTEFIDDIVSCGVNGFVMEPMTDMAYIAEKYGKTHSFIGNADTRVLLYGSKEDIFSEVKRCMDIGQDCPGFIMAVGNHIPANTPVDSCMWYDEACKLYGKR